MTVVGAVNGAPTTINASTLGSLTIAYNDNGDEGTTTVQPAGTPHTPVGSGPDRVAFIGGSTAGRDHFPVSVTDRPVGVYPAEYYPLGLSLSDMAKWMWRVKEWNLTGTITFDVTRDSDSTTASFTLTSISFPLAPSYLGLPITREADLLQLSDVSLTGGSRTFSGGFLPEESFIDTSDFNMTLMDRGYNPIVYAASLLYPQIAFGTFIIGNPSLTADGYEDAYFEIKVSAQNTSTEALASGWDVIADAMTLDGHAIGLYQSLDTNLCSVSNIASTLSLSATEYWPYATKAGLPVYDTTTGAQLHDPLS